MEQLEGTMQQPEETMQKNNVKKQHKEKHKISMQKKTSFL
jgi:hypothetical protein